MAADPIGAVVAVMLPADADAALQEGLHRGLRAVADEFDCPLIGGDTNAWPGKLVLSTTVFGRPGSTPPVRRSGARPGDWVFVTGALGGSILGHHLDFTPRIREARVLAVAVRLTAMIDISDGLSSEIHHIARESGVGAVLRAEAVPVSDAARELAARDGKPALHHALHDGEDFELLFTVPEDDGRWLAGPGRGKVPGPVTHIGRITAEPGVLLETDGRPEPLKRSGWEHLAASVRSET
jgi:thiamine-monophosphate kinase